jgi:type IV secretory pathway TraG/TraD family ATPase VirD4
MTRIVAFLFGGFGFRWRVDPEFHPDVGELRGIGEQRRPLPTPDEIMRLGSELAIVLVPGEPAWLLDRINYFADKAYADRFDPNPFHALQRAG